LGFAVGSPVAKRIADAHSIRRLVCFRQHHGPRTVWDGDRDRFSHRHGVTVFGASPPAAELVVRSAAVGEALGGTAGCTSRRACSHAADRHWCADVGALGRRGRHRPTVARVSGGRLHRALYRGDKDVSRRCTAAHAVCVLAADHFSVPDCQWRRQRRPCGTEHWRVGKPRLEERWHAVRRGMRRSVYCSRGVRGGVRLRRSVLASAPQCGKEA
jgi:hypothetical protein